MFVVSVKIITIHSISRVTKNEYFIICQYYSLLYKIPSSENLVELSVYGWADNENKPFINDVLLEGPLILVNWRCLCLLCKRKFVLSESTRDLVLFSPQERLAGVFLELGAEETEAVPFHLLYQHPIIQDCVHMCQRFKALVRSFFVPI